MIEIRWWACRGRALVAYLGLFALLLGYLAGGSGQFAPIHRALMGGFALAFMYMAAFRALNVTRLGLDGDALAIAHGPLPGRSRMRVPRAEVKEVAFDRSGRRLLLHTAQGEEVVLLDDLDVPDALDARLAQLLARRPGDGGDASDGAASGA
jgi:hypothetical protein